MEMIRSFIAIELPEEIRSDLKKVQRTLTSAGPAIAKWVDPMGIHLTLKFLGNIPQDSIDTILQSIQKASSGISPFCLELKGLGAFPNLRKVQVVWVGITGEINKLSILQKNLEADLSHLGFATENRSFTPHLTLARVRENATPVERQALGELIEKTHFESSAVIQVDSISLMKSQLTRSGAIYSKLGSIKLSPSCQ